MHTTLIKEVAESYAKRIWEDKELSAIDELIHEQCVIHSMLGDFVGQKKMKQVVQAWLTAFPDLIVTNTALIAENDLVMIHWKAKGTHHGEFKGIKPTNKPIYYAGITLYRINQGKIIEYWAYLDMQHLLSQLNEQD